ncbi:MAG: helicase HerA-like domain-containing protein, partial [Thiohalobacteraceae bacterium]
METSEHIQIGHGETPLHLLMSMANRHGLIAGATGTGKTVTLQVLAEGFSRCGVPVFMADVKGDLSGISQAGEAKPKLLERAQRVGLANFTPRTYPTLFWDLFEEQGHPIRTTISDMGPLLLARLLDLNNTQEAVLAIAFKLADDQGLLLLDLKDLRTLLTYISDNAKELKSTYGNISGASVGAIQRGLLVLEQQGTGRFFGEPALGLTDLMRTDFSGNGVISILAADKLMQTPKAYATLLLWLLAELFEELPEVGDQAKPKLVFFFDEAHLLFIDAPKALVQQVEQVVRLV